MGRTGGQDGGQDGKEERGRAACELGTPLGSQADEDQAAGTCQAGYASAQPTRPRSNASWAAQCPAAAGVTHHTVW